MKVHNHGPEEGEGLNCPEFQTPSGLVGRCMINDVVRMNVFDRFGEEVQAQDVPLSIYVGNERHVVGRAEVVGEEIRAEFDNPAFDVIQRLINNRGRFSIGFNTIKEN